MPARKRILIFHPSTNLFRSPTIVNYLISLFTGLSFIPPSDKLFNSLLLIKAAAMFKVMRDTPAIPDSLSPEGKDFLRCCFQRNPAERPSASVLLEHRFLKNSQQPDVPSCSLSFSGMKLTVSYMCHSTSFPSNFMGFKMYLCCPDRRNPMVQERRLMLNLIRWQHFQAHELHERQLWKGTRSFLSYLSSCPLNN